MPVLAKEAIEGTTGVEDGQVMAAALPPTDADPVCHAVGGQGIAIPLQEATARRASQVHEPFVTNRAQATIAVLSLPDLALPDTYGKKTGQICWREKPSVSDLKLSSLAGFFALIRSNLCTRHI